jgi:histidine triad (HIT) family protein
MTRDPDCIFCKIVDGEIPSFKVFEDDRTLAFMDINPAHPGHVLVIPKFHAADLYEIPDDWLAATTLTARRVARALRATLDLQGLNLVQCNGAAAAQSVMHYHMHVMERRDGDNLSLNWGLRPGDMDEIGTLAEHIRANVA